MAPWYDLARKRLAPIALILAFGLIARDACQRKRHDPVTLQLDLGPGAGRVRAVTMDVIADGEVVGRLHRGAEAAGLGPPKLSLPLPEGQAELRIELELDGAGAPRKKTVVRRIHAPHGALVTVPLADELTAPDATAP